MTVVLVTGSGSGIGQATAIGFAKQGGLVYAGLRNLDRVPAQLNHPNIHPLKLDVTCDQDISTAFQEMENIYGLPDTLINNAGINLPTTIEECSPENWQQIFEVNFFAPLKLSRKALPYMRQLGRGNIVMISSLSAELGLPFDGPYAASKAALNRMTECLASEVKPFGVRVLVMMPGAVETGLNQKPVEAASPILAYYALNKHMQEKEVGGSHGTAPAAIADEILAIVNNPSAVLFSPLGDQARHILKLIKDADNEERNKLIHEASGLTWWIEQNLTS